MIYLNAFIICGLICAIGQLVLEYTSLTPAHLNTFLVIAGSILSFFGIYDTLIKFSEAGATVPITNFGNTLFKGAYEGFKNDGITGFLTGILSNSSGGLTVTIIMSFIVSITCKPQN